MKNRSKILIIAFLTAIALADPSSATEYFVAPGGNNSNAGTKTAPLRTIQRGADLARPGDVVTVRGGVYRERITPPRGGMSDLDRIVFQAAPGERVEIKGSEVITNWVEVQADVWKVILPNSFFRLFNPYSDLIHGDWFDPKGREHHTGAVYLNGEWLIEAAKLDEVLMPAGTIPPWLKTGHNEYLLNVAWLRASHGSGSRALKAASAFTTHYGIQTAPCSEGGKCIGWIEHGDWARYKKVDFGQLTDELEIRAASATDGGLIDIRLDRTDGELLGTCNVSTTGGWQSWTSLKTRIKAVSGIQTVCLVFRQRNLTAVQERELNPQLWFAQVAQSNTTIWAQFKGVNPNEQLVEINVRRTVFYPDKPGRNFITVRGFTMQHAATPWAPPTAEQIGLIGTHWSKGWVIEYNIISHSICSGIALGKYGDQWDNTSADSAEGYVKTIDRALVNGWNRETIGHHLVRSNTISHCEQAGIVGSLGAAFSTVTDNTIRDIHVRRLFSGAEMAGIKFHAAIDTVIRNNHIYRTCRGLWLDWMAQGTRVSANLFHDNADQDLFVEVDHGPFVVDNNLFLSSVNLLDMSEGGAYAHNLFSGKIISRPEPSRQTPYHPAHSTTVAGLVQIRGGDDRFYNNLLIGTGGSAGAGGSQGRFALKDPEWGGGFGLWVYDFRELPLQARGNMYLNGARPYAHEPDPAIQEATNPKAHLVEEAHEFNLHLTLNSELTQTNCTLVTTALLGKAKIPQLAYEHAAGSPLKINIDFFGKPRSVTHPTPGPFEAPGQGELTLKLR